MGSEMCIRDSPGAVPGNVADHVAGVGVDAVDRAVGEERWEPDRPVMLDGLPRQLVGGLGECVETEEFRPDERRADPGGGVEPQVHARIVPTTPSPAIWPTRKGSARLGT